MKAPVVENGLVRVLSPQTTCFWQASTPRACHQNGLKARNVFDAEKGIERVLLSPGRPSTLTGRGGNDGLSWVPINQLTGGRMLGGGGNLNS